MCGFFWLLIFQLLCNLLYYPLSPSLHLLTLFPQLNLKKIKISELYILLSSVCHSYLWALKNDSPFGEICRLLNKSLFKMLDSSMTWNPCDFVVAKIGHFAIKKKIPKQHTQENFLKIFQKTCHIFKKKIMKSPRF
jgi:hypothetical protein